MQSNGRDNVTRITYVYGSGSVAAKNVKGGLEPTG